MIISRQVVSGTIFILSTIFARYYWPVTVIMVCLGAVILYFKKKRQ